MYIKMKRPEENVVERVSKQTPDYYIFLAVLSSIRSDSCSDANLNNGMTTVPVRSKRNTFPH